MTSEIALGIGRTGSNANEALRKYPLCHINEAKRTHIAAHLHSIAQFPPPQVTGPEFESEHGDALLQMQLSQMNNLILTWRYQARSP